MTNAAASQAGVPRTPAEWFAAGEAVFADVIAALAHYGVHVDPALQLVASTAPSPYYEPDTRVIGFGAPDPSTALGRLHWIFSARAFGLDTVDQAMAAAADFLPWLMAHEIAHHLRHHYGAPIANDFVEEQVCNELALAFVREHRVHASTLPRMRRVVTATAPRLAPLAPDAVAHAAGYRMTLGETLVAEGALAPDRAGELGRLARALGTTLDALLDGADLASDSAVSAAHARRDSAQEYFNRRYAASMFEYQYFGHEWLRAYLDRDDTPTFATALERHVLTSGWEQSRSAESALVLTTGLHHPDDALAHAAAAALAQDLGVEAIPALIGALTPSRPTLAAGVLRALRPFADDGRVAREGVRFLDAPVPSLRAEAAALAIATRTHAAHGSALLTSMLEQDDDARDAALVALASLDERLLTPAVLRALVAPSPRTRALAVRVLSGALRSGSGSEPNDPVILLVVRALTDRVDVVRTAAIDCLLAHAGTGLSPVALAEVAVLLDDDSAALRERAAEVLRAAGAAGMHAVLGDGGSLRRRVSRAAILHHAGHHDAGMIARALIDELLESARGFLSVESSLHVPEASGANDVTDVVLAGVHEERREQATLACKLAAEISETAPMHVALRGLTARDAAVRATACRLAAEVWPNAVHPVASDLPSLLDERRRDTGPLATMPSISESLAARVLAANPRPLLRELAAELALLQRHSFMPASSHPVSMLTTVEKLMYLRAVPIFQSVTLEQLRPLIDDMVVHSYAAGERVFGLGDPGDALFVVVSGRVAIEQDGADGGLERIAELTARRYFGETSLFSETPRSAVATALEPVTLLALTRDHLLALGARQPQVLVEALRVLSARLQDANADCG